VYTLQLEKILHYFENISVSECTVGYDKLLSVLYNSPKNAGTSQSVIGLTLPKKAKFAASKVSETGPDKLWKKVKLCQNASFPKNDTARFVSGNSLYYVSLQTLEPGECLDDQVSVVHLSQVVCSV